VHSLPPAAYLDLGLGSLICPHAPDGRTALDARRVEKEIAVARAHVLDAAAQVVEEQLLLPGVSLRGCRPRADERESLAAEDPHHDPDGPELAELEQYVVLGVLDIPVRELVPVLAGRREDHLLDRSALLGGQGGPSSGAFFPGRACRPPSLKALTQRRTMSASTRYSGTTCSASSISSIKMMAFRRRTIVPLRSFLNIFTSSRWSGVVRVTSTLGGRLMYDAKKVQDLRISDILSAG